MGCAPEELRWNIVMLWKQGLTALQVANTLIISYKVAKHWIERYKLTGGVQPIEKVGRKRALEQDGMERAHDLLVVAKHGTAKEVAKQLLA